MTRRQISVVVSVSVSAGTGSLRPLQRSQRTRTRPLTLTLSPQAGRGDQIRRASRRSVHPPRTLGTAPLAPAPWHSHAGTVHAGHLGTGSPASGQGIRFEGVEAFSHIPPSHGWHRTRGTRTLGTRTLAPCTLDTLAPALPQLQGDQIRQGVEAFSRIPPSHGGTAPLAPAPWALARWHRAPWTPWHRLSRNIQGDGFEGVEAFSRIPTSHGWHRTLGTRTLGTRTLAPCTLDTLAPALPQHTRGQIRQASRRSVDPPALARTLAPHPWHRTLALARWHRAPWTPWHRLSRKRGAAITMQLAPARGVNGSSDSSPCLSRPAPMTVGLSPSSSAERRGIRRRAHHR